MPRIRLANPSATPISMLHPCRVDLPELHGNHWNSWKLRCNMTQYETRRAEQLRKRKPVEISGLKVAGEPGFEPGLTESESVGLPLTYSPMTDRISLVETPGGLASQRSRVGAARVSRRLLSYFPGRSRGINRFLLVGSGRRQLRRGCRGCKRLPAKRIWRFRGKLLQSRQRQNRAGACCGRMVFARREWTSK